MNRRRARPNPDPVRATAARARFRVGAVAARRACVGVLVALVAAVAVGRSAEAAGRDDRPLEPPPLEEYVRWGPVRVRPGIALRDAGYDSNVFNSPDPQGDYRVTLAPRLEALVLFGDRAFVTADGELRYTAYAKFRDLAYWDGLGSARLTVPIGRIAPYVETIYERIRQSPLDLDDARPVRTRIGSELGVYVEVGAKTSVRLGRLDDDITNRDDDFGRTDLEFGDLLDRRETRDRLTLEHEALGRTTLSLVAESGQVRFRTPNVTGAPGFERDATSLRFGPGIRLGAGALTGEIRISWIDVDYEGEQLVDYAGLLGDARVRARFAGRWTVELEAERDLGFSVTEGNAYWILDRGSILLDVRMRRWLSLEGSTELGTLDLPATGRQDELSRWFVGLGFRIPESTIGRKVVYRLRAGRARRDSSVAALDRERNFVAFTADLGF